MKTSKKALIVTNILREQPGSILDVLEKRGWQSTIVNLDQGDSFPSPTNYDALIVMGGPPSANDTSEITPWMPDEIKKIQQALKANIPYYGVCLGFQTLVKAAGGMISKSPRKEVGFRESYGEQPGKFYSIQLTEAGGKDPLFKDLPHTLPLFHLHGETVELPDTMEPKATLLATGEVVPNQFIKIGENAYGSQGHFQVTAALLEVWLKVDTDLLDLKPQGVEQVWKDFLQIQQQYTKTAIQLFNNFLDITEKQ